MTRWARVRLIALLLCFCCVPSLAEAHPLDTASLSLSESAPGQFRVRFQSGSPSLTRELERPALFPAPCRLAGELAVAQLDCGPAGLAGTLEFPWLEGTLTRLMVDIEWRDGSRSLRVVTASVPRLTVYGPSEPGRWVPSALVGDYVELGIEHILSGFDHLFFVIALTILVRRRRALLATVTAFTVAHSLTLAATTLELLEVPSAPVEALIALSIVLVCAECLSPADSWTRRAPWLVAFAFGLLHGLGFASALLEVGLPERHLPSALLSFNLGVELGQLAVIGVSLALGSLALGSLALGSLVARAAAQRTQLARTWALRGLVYAMGSVAAFWFLDRVVAVFQS